MGDSHHHHLNNHQATTSSRLGIRPPSSGGGVSTDIVEVVRGSHIVRATGRKDRHSKVCTAKGPRDRRVRLAAHTAIQFYDVQDRLGYDRPSKAVDWLIKKAKAAIDELEELPSWNPHSISTTAAVPAMETQNPSATGIHCFAAVDAIGSANRRTMVGSGVSEQQFAQNPNSNSTFLPPSLDSDAIADTIKSFFPMGASAAAAAAESPSSTIQFHQNYPPDLLSKTSSQSQDLRLSLQSFQDPILLHHHDAQNQHHHAQTHQNEQTLFSGSQNQLGFDGSPGSWAEHHHNQQQQEMNRFQRMVAWDSGGNGGPSSAGGFIFNSLLPTQQGSTSPLQQQQPSLFGQSQFFSQRGPLQSSNSPSVRAWMVDQQNQQSISHDHHHQISQSIHHQQSISGMGFASGGGFSGFHIPARIHGEEEHDGLKLSSHLCLPQRDYKSYLLVPNSYMARRRFFGRFVQWRAPWEEEI
ncbi:hypothetical protein ACFX2I_030848 [Malus domestica]